MHLVLVLVGNLRLLGRNWRFFGLSHHYFAVTQGLGLTRLLCRDLLFVLFLDFDQGVVVGAAVDHEVLLLFEREGVGLFVFAGSGDWVVLSRGFGVDGLLAEVLDGAALGLGDCVGGATGMVCDLELLA